MFSLDDLKKFFGADSIEVMQNVPINKKDNIMKIQDLKDRISFYENNRAQALSVYNACGGAIEDCNYWIGILTVEENLPTPDTSTSTPSQGATT